jgi:hypothetical protein
MGESYKRKQSLSGLDFPEDPFRAGFDRFFMDEIRIRRYDIGRRTPDVREKEPFSATEKKAYFPRDFPRACSGAHRRVGHTLADSARRFGPENEKSGDDRSHP